MFALVLGVAIVAVMLAWSDPARAVAYAGTHPAQRRERRQARGRHAITQGLLAIGHGDAAAARLHADAARRHAAHDPLALLLHAQSAQLDGDREGARRAFRAMAEREDTRLFGLRGLFIEAQRADDPVGAVMIAEEALKLRAGLDLGVACRAGIPLRQGRLERRAGHPRQQSRLAGLIDKAAYGASAACC